MLSFALKGAFITVLYECHLSFRAAVHQTTSPQSGTNHGGLRRAATRTARAHPKWATCGRGAPAFSFHEWTAPRGAARAGRCVCVLSGLIPGHPQRCSCSFRSLRPHGQRMLVLDPGGTFHSFFLIMPIFLLL